MRLKLGNSARWFLVLAAFITFLVLPGPVRSPFSGVPLSSRGTLLFAVLILVSLLTVLFPPSRKTRLAWVGALLVAAVGKLLLAQFIVPIGFHASYRTAQLTADGFLPMQPAKFQWRGSSRQFRVDRHIDFEGANFGLFYVNDMPVQKVRRPTQPRDVAQPLLVRWTGYAHPSGRGDFAISVTARGRVSIASDGRQVFTAENPQQQRLNLSIRDASYPVRVSVEYWKPPGEKPAIHLLLPEWKFTAAPADGEALARGAAASWAIELLGCLALLTLIAAFFEAYRPMSGFFLERIWRSPDRVAVIAFASYFLALGVARAIPIRHATMPLSHGDDPLGYEGMARQILSSGLLMLDDQGSNSPYVLYPLYPYILALSHFVFGDDFASIILLNYYCIGSIAVFLWLIMKGRIAPGSMIVVLLAAWLFARRHLIAYAGVSYSDNLFVPLVFLVLAASIAAMDRGKVWLVFLAGILTALGAATRPSLLLYVPCFGLALLLCGAGSMATRVRGSLTFVAGFFTGVSPFTARNWIVSKRFVLLISSFIMLPFFLYSPEEERPSLLIGGNLPGLFDAIAQFLQHYSQAPGHFTWVAARKILFTFGFTHFGPSGVDVPRYFVIFPIAFGLAAWTRRIDRPVKVVLLAFGASHLLAMVLAAPWTYGYKTILPLHLAFLLGASFLLPRHTTVPTPVASPSLRPVLPRRRTVSVVLPTYNEKDSIRRVIQDFVATGVADEILVVNNNAAPGTSEEIAGTGAREIFEVKQGYGVAIRRGIREARGEYVVICEPDATFLPRDIFKLLAYAEDFDAVYGSRTSQQLIWRGANMDFFLRWGNWAVAKYLQFLYNATSLTDVGCTLRLVRREVIESLKDQFRIDGNEFGLEMMILTLRHGYRVVQVPVNYLPRVGVSSVTGDPAKAFYLGLRMIWLITSRRFEHLFAPRPLNSTSPAASSIGHDGP